MMISHPVKGSKIFFLSFVSVLAMSAYAHAGFEMTGSTKPAMQEEVSRQRPAENYVPASTAVESVSLPLSLESDGRKPAIISMDQNLSSQMIEPSAEGVDEVMLAPEMPAPSKTPTNLVINYYPLGDVAIHGGAQVRRSIEQAMIEGGGDLRPIVVPGSDKMVGIRAASRSGQYGGMGYDTVDEFESGGMPTSLTPIPGGEGRKIAGIEQQPLPAIAPAPQNSGGAFAEAVGFGRDLPLALALSQIIPPEYSYVFGQNVDVGATVSWQGGKPWNDVLNDMLAPSGMKAVIRNQTIMIRATNS